MDDGLVHDRRDGSLRRKMSPPPLPRNLAEGGVALLPQNGIDARMDGDNSITMLLKEAGDDVGSPDEAWGRGHHGEDAVVLRMALVSGLPSAAPQTPRA